MNYELVRELNEKLPKMNIKGKEYVMVKDRVAAFRQACPGGSIVTNVLTDDGVRIMVQATVSDEEGRILGQDIAQEVYNSTQINKTSAAENCSTSAIGRALALCGIGIDDSFASANEVQQAIAQQDHGDQMPRPTDKVSKKDLERVRVLLDHKEVHPDTVLEHYGIEKLEDMTLGMYRDLVLSLGGKA